MTNFPLIFITLSLAVYVLMSASAFFIPLVVALVISFLIITFSEWIGTLKVGKWRMPRGLSYLVSILTLLLAIWLVVVFVGQNVASLISVAPEYQQKLVSLFTQFSDLTGIKEADFSKYFENFDLVTVISSLVFMLTEVASYSGLIAIYVIFIMIEYHFIGKKLDFVVKKDSRDNTWKVIKKVLQQIQSYLRIKTLLSVLTAGASYLVLIAVGVDFASFWAFLIFLLNYIPTIGSIIATIFPCLLTLIQFDSLTPFFIVTPTLTAIQFTVGNFLEPKVMGSKFNLSGLVIVLSLAIWGKIWGILGMFLCVPFLVIATIILANFKKTRPIAIMLSQDGAVK